MLFVLLDIAGLRADTREILIAVQKTFRTLAPELLFGEDFNETTAMIEVCDEMNLTILHGGLRSCPAFIGCYNENLGTECYANAGRGCFAITRGSRRSRPPGCRWDCSRTRCKARLAVTLCSARLFWLSPAESSKGITSTRITRLRNSDWTG